jgi:3'(2'), 5'-bisphosphate nucleotidase
MSFSHLIPQIIALSRQAGKAVLDIYHTPSDQWNVQYKADASPLTIADNAANNIILEGLREITPDIPIISEESLKMPYAKRKNWERCWVIDPLDGTKEFVKKTNDFTINIALVEDRRPVLSVVLVPYTDVAFWAVRGEGAYTNHANIDTRLQCKPFSMTQSGLRVACSSSHINQATTDYIAKFNQPKLTSLGSSLKFLMIATNEIDVYPRATPTMMEWDTAAPELIITEAGGKMHHLRSGKPFLYNKKVLNTPSFMAMGSGILVL